jgi:hypothetical protein
VTSPSAGAFASGDNTQPRITPASVRVYGKPNIAWHDRYAQYFYDGLRKLGVTAEFTSKGVVPPARDNHVDVLFGPNHFRAVQNELAAQGRPYLIVNRAWWGDPDAVAITWNAINGYAYWPELSNELLRPVGVPAPPRAEPLQGYVLLLGQARLHTYAFTSLEHWYGVAVQEAVAVHGRHVPVVFRPHPSWGGDAPPGTQLARHGSLQQALAGAKQVLTLNSTAAVECMQRGVPTVAYDRGSPVWDCAARHPSQQPAWGRWGQVERRLGRQQWRWEELAAGTPWAALWAQRGAAGPGLAAFPE